MRYEVGSKSVLLSVACQHSDSWIREIQNGDVQSCDVRLRRPLSNSSHLSTKSGQVKAVKAARVQRRATLSPSDSLQRTFEGDMRYGGIPLSDGTEKVRRCCGSGAAFSPSTELSSWYSDTGV